MREFYILKIAIGTDLVSVYIAETDDMGNYSESLYESFVYSTFPQSYKEAIQYLNEECHLGLLDIQIQFCDRLEQHEEEY